MRNSRGWSEERSKRFVRPVKGSSPSMHAAFARRITADWVPKNKYVFLDVGTGPGRMPVEVKILFPQARVIGIDPSEFMVHIAHQNVEKAGFSDIEILPGSVERIPLDSQSVDLAFAQHTLLFWEDPKQGFSEIHRVLKQDGKLVIWDWNKSYPRLKFYWQNFNTMRRAGLERAKDVRSSFRQAYRFQDALQMVIEGKFKPVETQGKELNFFIKAVKS